MADPMLGQILPPEAIAVETFEDDHAAKLFPEEEAVIARAVDKRRREFTTGRACARAALAQLGEPPTAIPQGLRGAPQWPAGVTGSITHCDGYRAVAVARLADLAALGVDAEPNKAIPSEVLDLIALDAEREMVATLAVTEPGVCWDRLLFCAKESVYKAWFPLANRWLGFEDAHVTINPHEGAAAAPDERSPARPHDGAPAGQWQGAFAARLLVPGPLVAGTPLTVLRGRWLAAAGLIVTAIPLPAAPRG